MFEIENFPSAGSFKGASHTSRVGACLEIWPVPILSLNDGLEFWIKGDQPSGLDAHSIPSQRCGRRRAELIIPSNSSFGPMPISPAAAALIRRSIVSLTLQARIRWPR
jgi:hypothetical protein